MENWISKFYNVFWKNDVGIQAPVTHPYYSNYSGGRVQADHCSKPALGK
jgi:hypothetical protein